MGIKRALWCALLSTALAQPAAAQFGAALGVRGSDAGPTDATRADRRGFEMRGFYDHGSARWGLRTEAAFTQTQFQRDIGIDVRQVSENGAEFSMLGRATGQQGVLANMYAVAGPLLSLRISCGASGGFVDCDEGPMREIGYVLGAGYATAISMRRDLLFEVRYLGNAISGAGHDVVALTIGLRTARR